MNVENETETKKFHHEGREVREESRKFLDLGLNFVSFVYFVVDPF